jgi:hypothetical protein
MNSGAYAGDNQPVFSRELSVAVLSTMGDYTRFFDPDRWQPEAAATSSFTEEDSHEC